jgi:hypothetical protein
MRRTELKQSGYAYKDGHSLFLVIPTPYEFDPKIGILTVNIHTDVSLWL